MNTAGSTRRILDSSFGRNTRVSNPTSGDKNLGIIFPDHLNDAYGWVKEEAEKKAEKERELEEEREALGIVDEKVSRRDKAKALAAAARGRYRRFKNRVKSLRLRKRTAPPTGISDF